MNMLAEGINPKILRWAREAQGLDLEEAASELNRNVEEIVSWESGYSVPTYPQLEKAASKYKRPIALFFFPEIPNESGPRQSFRTLPNSEISNLIPDTYYAFRMAQVMLLNLRELNSGINPKKKEFLKKFSLKDRDEVSIAKRLRDILGFSLKDQIKWNSTKLAFDHWRDSIQEHGIYVFKRAFRQDDISGFCLYDDDFPIIYVNNSSPSSRQIFTLFHELAHILCQENGVTKTDDRYIKQLKNEDQFLEIFCNKVAAEVLVPSDDFDNRIPTNSHSDDEIISLAQRYKVSREVILRKLYDRGMVDQIYYEEKTLEWNKNYREYREDVKQAKQKKGNWYLTQGSYLGKYYLKLTFSQYYQNKFGIDQLADYLNVKTKFISRFEQLAVKEFPK